MFITAVEQVVEVVQGVQSSEGQSGRVLTANPPKLFVFVHGGAWGSGSTWCVGAKVSLI